MEERKYPCDAVIKLQERVEEQEKRLEKGSVQFATINTKLNMLMAILAAIGVAVLGVVVGVMF